MKNFLALSVLAASILAATLPDPGFGEPLRVTITPRAQSHGENRHSPLHRESPMNETHMRDGVTYSLDDLDRIDRNRRNRAGGDSLLGDLIEGRGTPLDRDARPTSRLGTFVRDYGRPAVGFSLRAMGQGFGLAPNRSLWPW